MMLTTTILTPRNTFSPVPLWRLLWKEWRERRWWALGWALSMLVVGLIAQAQRYYMFGNGAPSVWNCLPLLFAGVVGLGGYASELQRGRALFLCARAVRWQELLLAKLLFGVIVSLGLPALAATLLFLTCPGPYHAVITPSHLLAGIGAEAWPMLLCYAGGLACSVLLPGLAGSVLAVVSIAIIIGFALFCAELLFGMGLFDPWWCLLNHAVMGPSVTNSMGVVTHVGMLCFAVIGILWGGVTVARAGIYQDYLLRIKHFAPKMLLPMLIGGLLGLCLPQSLAERWFIAWEAVDQGAVLISPGGSYAMVTFAPHYVVGWLDISRLAGYPTGQRQDIIRLADKVVVKSFMLPQNADDTTIFSGWVTDTVAKGNRKIDNNHEQQMLYHLDTGKMIPTTEEHLGTPSPNGRYTAYIDTIGFTEDKKLGGCRTIYLCNLENGHTATMLIPVDDLVGSSPLWWESNDTVAYYRKQESYGMGPDKRLYLQSFHEAVHRLRVPKF